MNYNKYSACLLSLISIFFGFYKVNAGHFHSKTKKNTGSSPIMKDLDDINGPIINDNNSSLIKEWTAANNFHCRLYENGHLIVEATMPNSTIVNIFENHANLKNKVKQFCY